MANNPKPPISDKDLATMLNALIGIGLETNPRPGMPSNNSPLPRDDSFICRALAMAARRRIKIPGDGDGEAARQQAFLSGNYQERPVVPLDDRSVTETWPGAQVLAMPDFGIAVLLPASFSRPGLQLRPYQTTASRGRVVAYGPHRGAGSTSSAEPDFMVEIRDEARLQRRIRRGLFGTWERLLKDIYESLYGRY
ncbi:hypothetical protein Trco_006037 [Trichoderma cornu-damae]|uniref:Uncharacterized protein n=1 Tax=Trichoderma cornu-damae TaxID=654480 RepID=A0A9P8QKL7_9HYPO|nr:hypothetical protein Trco_006037 [Trichoderma cornu-damae]